MRPRSDMGFCTTEKKKWLNMELCKNSNMQGCCYRSPAIYMPLPSFNKINILNIYFERYSFNIIFPRSSRSSKVKILYALPAVQNRNAFQSTVGLPLSFNICQLTATQLVPAVSCALILSLKRLNSSCSSRKNDPNH